MFSDELFEKLNYLKAYRKNRLEAANWVLSNTESFPELLKYCFVSKDEISYKAAWVLEFVCVERLDLLLPHLDYFFENLPNIKKDQSLRALAKICEILTLKYYKKKIPEVVHVLNKNHKTVMTECCFDWMISNKKVACQAHAMLSLYYLGTEINWIHPELKTLLLQNMHNQSAGYKARAKHILNEDI